MKSEFPFLIFMLAMSFLLQCGPVTGFQEEYDRAVLAYIQIFNVPDSSGQSIPVYLKGTIGETTAYRFDRINVIRTDTLFRIAVWGRHVFKTGINYPPQEVRIDTNLILNTPSKGTHYVEVVAAQGVLRDSTQVY